MKFGEAVKVVFDGHFEDLASKPEKCTRYTNEKLLCAISVIPWKWKRFLYEEFAIIQGVIRRHILECPHDKTQEPYQSRRECLQCGSYQSFELEDQDPHSYNERKIWSEWKI